MVLRWNLATSLIPRPTFRTGSGNEVTRIIMSTCVSLVPRPPQAFIACQRRCDTVTWAVWFEYVIIKLNLRVSVTTTRERHATNF